MHLVELNKIYVEIARRYKCHRFEVFNTMSLTGRMPIESMIEFQLPSGTNVDEKYIATIMAKYIGNVKYFYFIIQDNSIFLMIQFHKKKNMLGTEYEYSLN